MTTATQRIPVLVTPAEKKQIAKMAKDAGLSMGEFFRRAATAFRPSDEEKLLEGMIEQMNKTTAQASAAIDDALAFVEASNKRIAAMEREIRQKMVA
ncbi:hypothetical protein AGMMS50256_38420 [Betaproteobacteria bacterium]|nr:hypothetical protein AGMMS50256_38420 [Betaproteobacteria bacterium]